LVAYTEGRRRLRVFENKMLRRIFGPKRDAVTRGWRELHIEELNDLHSSTNTIRVIISSRIRWAEHVESMGESSGVYRVLVGEPEGERPLERPRLRWVDNIKMDLRGGMGGMHFLHMAQNRNWWRELVNAEMTLRVPQNADGLLIG